MSFATGWQKEQDKEDAERREWALVEYDNGDSGCEKCGRMRVCMCPNGKHRCEKCDWCPEEKRYVDV